MDDFDRLPLGAGLIRAVSPAAIRRWLRAEYQRWVFRRAVKEFAQNPEKIRLSTSALIPDLIYGWDNEGWSAFPEYVSACVEEALTTEGPILECGSGLTTILLGLIAQRRGKVVWTLENSPQWAERVNKSLKKYRI